MAMAVLSSSQHQQPLRHCPTLPFRRIDKRPRGLAYALDSRLKLNRTPAFVTPDERLHILIERCHFTLRLSSSSHGLKHGPAGEAHTRSAIRALGKDGDNCGADRESAEWISNAVRDPMVEVDPVTVSNQMLAEKQSRPLELSTALVDSPPPVSQRIVRLRHIAVVSAIAVFLLAVVAVIQYLRARKIGERRSLKEVVDSSTSTGTESMEEPVGASQDAINGTAAAVAGSDAVEEDRIVPPVWNFPADLEDVVLKNKPAYEWPDQNDFPKGFSTTDIAEPNLTFTDAVESLDRIPIDTTYREDLTGQANVGEGWNITDGNGSSQGLVEETTIDKLIDQSLSKIDQDDASLVQNVSEVSDSKVFEDAPETGFNEELAFVEEQHIGQGASRASESNVTEDQGSVEEQQLDQGPALASEGDVTEDEGLVEEPHIGQGSSVLNEGDVTEDQGLSSSHSDSAEPVEYLYMYTSDGILIENGGRRSTGPLSLDGKSPVERLPNPSYLTSSDADSSHPGTHSTLGLSSHDAQVPSKSAFESQADDLRVLEPLESELPPFESLEMGKDKASELERERSAKALEQALPALFVTIGTVGTLWGVTGGLKVVGFAAAMQLLSQELFWAESRDAFWREIQKITDRQKLRIFLSKRNAVHDN